MGVTIGRPSQATTRAELRAQVAWLAEAVVDLQRRLTKNTGPAGFLRRGPDALTSDLDAPAVTIVTLNGVVNRENPRFYWPPGMPLPVSVRDMMVVRHGLLLMPEVDGAFTWDGNAEVELTDPPRLGLVHVIVLRQGRIYTGALQEGANDWSDRRRRRSWMGDRYSPRRRREDP